MKPSLATSRWLWWGVPALFVMLWAVGALLPGAVEGLPEAPWTTWVSLPVVRFARDIAAAIALGCAVVGGLLVTGRSPRLLRWASGWAVVWLAVLLVELVLTVSDLLAVSAREAIEPTTLWSVLSQTTVGKVFIWQFVGAVLVAVLSWGVMSRPTAWVVAIVALGACVAPAWLGHGGLAGGHAAATISLALHMGAASLWVGGLVAVVAYLLQRPTAAASVLPRFSALALGCVIVVAESGLLNASLRLTSPADFLTTTYGALVLGKAVLLGWLVLFGWRQRTRVIPALDAAGSASVPVLARLAALEFAAMGVAFAAAITMSRLGPLPTPPLGHVLNPVVVVLAALALPQLVIRFHMPAPRRAWARLARDYPEVVAIVMCLAVVEVAGVGLVDSLLGRGLGSVVGVALLVAVGWAFAVGARGPRGRSGVVVAMVGWLGASLVVARFELARSAGGVDSHLTLAALALGEGLLLLTLLRGRTTASPTVSVAETVKVAP